MNLHQTIAQELQCSRLWVDRALTMLNVIADMSSLSIQEQATVISLLLQHLGQSPIPEEITLDLLNDAPLEDWSSLSQDYWQQLIFGLGGDTVSEALPLCLTELIGVAPAEPDPEEIATLRQDMWENYIPPGVLSESATQEEEYSPPPEESTTEELVSPQPQGSWGVIFRSYSPSEERFTYTLLNTARTIDSTNISQRQFWSEHRRTDWPEAQINTPLCFQTPICTEEEQIIADFTRQEGPFDCLYLLAIEQNLPGPSLSETLSLEKAIQATHTQHLSSSGLSFQARNQTLLEWSGGVLPLHLKTASILDTSQKKTKLSWQALAQWKISIHQVSGKPQDIPGTWRLNVERQQRIKGDGGKAGTIDLRNACFIHLQNEHTEYFLGERNQKIDLPFRPFLNPDSNHQALFQEDTALEIGTEAILLRERSIPTLKFTPPIDREERQSFRTAITAKELCFSVFIEQANLLKQQDATLDASLSATNIIDVSFSLELQWGTNDSGFLLSIPAQQALSLVTKGKPSNTPVSLQQSIGTLHIFGQHPQRYTVDQVIARTRKQFQKQEQSEFQMQTTWNSALEHPKEIESSLSQSLQLHSDQIGWTLSQTP